MRIIIFVVLCCVCRNYGETNTERAKPDMITILFDIRISEGEANCIPGIEDGNQFEEIKELVIETGRKLRLNAGIQTINGSIQKANCSYDNGSGPQNLADEYVIQLHRQGWFEEHEVKNTMYGKWTCRLRFNKDTQRDIRPVDGAGYTYVLCDIAVKNPDAEVSTTPIPAALENTPVLDNKLLFIIVGVGILVLLIIIGQTIALCYFKRRAQPRRRMDNMTPRIRFDRGDQARYSAPPCKKSKTPDPAPDRDSHIYEMVGVNALYNKSSYLTADVNNESKEPNGRHRPPLPLPHEIPELAETLPPPPRPPKQIDEESIPGSLKRPAKTAPSPTSAAAPAPASAKSCYKHKTPVTECPMSELKTLLRNRNIGTDTPTSSPTATLENKEPPKVQKKPNKKSITPANSTPPPNVATKPVVPVNQIKLILPKIEASLKTPKPLHTPKTTEPTNSPNKPPVISEKPVPKVAKKWPPIAQKAQPAPEMVNQPVLKSPLQNRPLLRPDLRPTPDPVPQNEDPGLPPIYQTADDDETRDTDDDEEWTYEQLEPYNIYNL